MPASARYASHRLDRNLRSRFAGRTASTPAVRVSRQGPLHGETRGTRLRRGLSQAPADLERHLPRRAPRAKESEAFVVKAREISQGDREIGSVRAGRANETALRSLATTLRLLRA